jgi:MHS family proline/betaine transporter-like MFS transporter
MNLGFAVTFYLMFVYSVTWLSEYVHESRSAALDINTAVMALVLVATPLCATLSDRWGRKKMLVLGATATVVLAWPLLWLMHHPDPILILAGGFGFALLVAAYSSSVPAMMTEMFPAEVRVSAVSVGYNLAFAIFGGTSPLVAVWLLKTTHDDLAFAWYISGSVFVSLLVVLTLKDRRNEPLD